MRAAVIAYVAGIVVMAVLDVAWLGLTSRLIYRPGIGHLMAEKPALGAGILFYLVYIAGLTYLVTLPALQHGVGYAAGRGAVLGLMAYATFDLTAQSVLRDWPVSVTVVDMIWGTILTAITAAAATYLAGKFG